MFVPELLYRYKKLFKALIQQDQGHHQDEIPGMKQVFWAHVLRIDLHSWVGLLSCLLVMLPVLMIPHPVVLLIASMMPLGLFLILRQPIVVCLIFILFSFFRIHEIFPSLDPLKIPKFSAIASYFVLLWHIGLTRKVQLYWCHEMSLFFCFFSWVVVSILFSSYMPIAFDSFTSVYLKISIMLFAIAWLMTRAYHFRIAHLAIVFCGVSVGCVALYNQMNHIGLVESTRVTIPGTSLGDPNDLALVLSFPLSFAIALFMTEGTGKIAKGIGLVSFGICMLAIIATQSRGGLLASVAIMAFFAMKVIRSRLVVMSAGSFMLMLLMVVAGISERQSGGDVSGRMDESAQGRIHAWETAINMTLHNPLTGVGLSLFLDNYWNYARHAPDQGLAHVTHNTWLQIMSETGLVGFILFLLLIAGIFRSIHRSVALLEQSRGSPYYDPYLLAIAMGTFVGLIGFCVSGTFLSQGFLWPFYIMAALGIALAHFTDSNKMEVNRVELEKI
ncbi:hypothetical protein CI610_00077 [invertebrate metagenome]|uniref:O-antigen ligase-related domain-containing protein n=1 Tax=invertebrate metagenome TaxID=1711999 RepID=A0A2H9TCL2_9ZZZZ